jgi:glycolate oxidase FAD binding subunit
MYMTASCRIPIFPVSETPVTLAPQTEQDVAEAVRSAAAEKCALEIVGHGSKRTLGSPVRATTQMSLTALRGVVDYAPEEMTLTVKPGTLYSEIEPLMAQRKQRLAFEPPDLGMILEGVSSFGSVGGIVAANIAGPRRRSTGAVRDHVLGFTAVNGRAEIFTAGGKVVKNVTGYDLPKLLTGSFGTLALMTEITLRVNPAPETECTVAVFGADDVVAMKLMQMAIASPHEVAGAAHLPRGVNSLGPGAVTLIRLEGFAPSVDYRAGLLTELLKNHGRVERIAAESSQRLWAMVRDAMPLAGTRPLWRISIAPAAGAQAAAAITQKLNAEYFYDWGGGLIWLAVNGDVADAGTQAVREVVAAMGGHATLIRAPETIRAVVPVFQPQPAAIAALQHRVKTAFDPQNVLNPFRMSMEY